MRQDNTGAVIDFTGYIVESTHIFTGREWVLNAINDWLADPNGARCFLLTGKPGSGKTAIIARLAQFSQGSVPSPDNLIGLMPNFLSAFHFCSARDRRWINPKVFAESLALQLAGRYQVFAEALAEKRHDQHITIEVTQTIASMTGGNVIGLAINKLDVSGLSSEDAFIHVVREPLEALLDKEPDKQVIIMVDALDEALSYSGDLNIVSLLAQAEQLCHNVRFILTSRLDARVVNEFLNAYELPLSTANFDKFHQKDLREYVQTKLHSDDKLATEASQLTPQHLTEIVEMLSRRAEGNFLYITFLLNAIARGLRPLTALEGLPEGLDELYFESLGRTVKLGGCEWLRDYAPLVGILSVAQESLTLAQLQAFTGLPESSLWKYIGDLQQFIEEITSLREKGGQQEERYRLYHQSVIDFLRCKSLLRNNRQLRNGFYLPEQEWHRIMADRCGQGTITLIWEDINHNLNEQGRREYSRRYHTTHLYYAQAWQQLFALLDSEEYGRAKIGKDSGIHFYIQDLDLGIQAASSEKWSVSEGIAALPQLWRYSLLRSSLISQLNRGLSTRYDVLFLQGRKQEALSLADTITNPVTKIRLLLQVARQVVEQSGYEQECLQLFTRSHEIARAIQDSYGKIEALGELAKTLVEVQQQEYANRAWNEIEESIQAIEDIYLKIEGLCEFAKALVEVQQQEYANRVWDEAEAMAWTIQDGRTRSQLLCRLVATLVQARLWERSQRIAYTIEKSWYRAQSLCELSIGLTRAQRWEHSYAMTQTIEKGWYKVESLCELSIALAQAQQRVRAATVLDEAEAAARAIQDKEYRLKALNSVSTASAQVHGSAFSEGKTQATPDSSIMLKMLCELGKALAQVQQWERATHVLEQAEAITQFIQDDDDRLKVLRELGIALVQAQLWERFDSVFTQAKVLVQMRPSYGRLEVLRDLGIALVRAQRWEQAEAICAQAETVARTVQYSGTQINVLQDLGIALVKEQQWKRAEAVAQTIRYGLPQAKIDVLCELATTLANAQQLKHARILWAQAEALIREINRDYYQDLGSHYLGISLARAQQWERANAVAQSVQTWYSYAKPRILYALSITLAETKQWEQAEAVAQMIEWHYTKFDTLCELGTLLARNQQLPRAHALFSQAEEIARTMEISRDKTRFLCDLGVALALSQQWERANVVLNEAERVAYLVKKDRNSILALCDLGVALAKAQQWERANEVAQTINENSSKFRVLCELGIALAKAQQWERAETVAQTISDDDYSLEVLREVRIQLVTANEYEQLLRLVQQAWRQAKTRRYAIKLLSLASGFVSLKPEIGTDLCEVFAWVDTLLN